MITTKLLRPLLPLLLLAGCQSAAPTPDEQTPGKEVAQESCCPAGTTQVDACADEAQCIQLMQHGQPLVCAIATAEGADEPDPQPQACDALLGYRWDGQQCRGVSGCSRGPGVWYDAKEVCERAHSHCGAATP